MKKPLLYFFIIILNITFIMTQSCNQKKDDITKSSYIATYLTTKEITENQFWYLFDIRNDIDIFLIESEIGTYVGSSDIESVYRIYSRENEDKMINYLRKVLEEFEIKNYKIQVRFYEDEEWKQINHFADK